MSIKNFRSLYLTRVCILSVNRPFSIAYHKYIVILIRGNVVQEVEVLVDLVFSVLLSLFPLFIGSPEFGEIFSVHFRQSLLHQGLSFNFVVLHALTLQTLFIEGSLSNHGINAAELALGAGQITSAKRLDLGDPFSDPTVSNCELSG